MLTLPTLVGVSGIYYGATSIDFVCAMWLLSIVLLTFRNAPAGRSP
jgi:hypothetical protein